MSAVKRIISGVVGFLMTVVCGMGQDPSLQAREIQRLETELSLTKSAAFYFLLHIESRTLELKAKGIPLRSWKIAQSEASGRRASEGVMTVMKKAASFVPTRTKIKPEKEAEEPSVKAEPSPPASGEYDLQAFEVQDMPERFEIVLDSGLKIICGPQKQGVSSLLEKAGRTLFIPLKTLVMTLKKQNFSILELGFEEKKEAQAIYWTIFEGQKIYVLNN